MKPGEVWSFGVEHQGRGWQGRAITALGSGTFGYLLLPEDEAASVT